MTTRTNPTSASAPAKRGPAPRGRAAEARRQARRRQARRRLLVRGGLAAVAVAVGLFVVSQGGRGTSGGGPHFAVGQPGPGASAPPIRLASTAGGTWDLGAQQGKTVLLYFQEGLGCQPCWNQIRDVEAKMSDFKALGIDEFVSITSDDLDLLRQKVSDEHLESPVLSDPDLSLGKTYSANQYGMMGTSRYGHSFIVVGSDGRIRWRGDYGGAPNYTMYVRPGDLLSNLRQGLAKA